MLKYLFWFIIVPALLPVVLVFWYVYHKDKYEREPLGLVLKVVLFGAIFSLVCIPVERFLEGVIYSYYGGIVSVRSEFVQNTVGVGLVEELIKWSVVMIFVWRTDDFDFRYDGIVYSVSSALGFAGLENILYVLNYGTSVSIGRAIFSIPGHAAFGVFMGFYLSRAKDCELKQNGFGRGVNLVLSVAVPVLVHGMYDFLLSDISMQTGLNSYFIFFVLIVDILAWLFIRHEFKTDRPLGE